MKEKLMLLVSLMCFTAIHVCSQNTLDATGPVKTAKELRTERKIAEEAQVKKMTDSLMNIRKFVLEAKYLSMASASGQITDNLNFIMVDEEKVTIQMGSNQRLSGNNGVGGITVEGKIYTFDVKKTGKGEGQYLVKITTVTPLGSYDITMHISRNSNATAFIDGLISDRVAYHGAIKSLEKSSVYKARSL